MSESEPAPESFLLENLKSLHERAESGNANAQRDLGCAYIWGPEGSIGLLSVDLALARHWYTLAAEQGHHEAMWDVSHMLLDGEGGPVDIERGLRYLRFLATRRHWVNSAQYAAELLAYYHESGKYGCAIDTKASERWLRIAKDHRRRFRGFCRGIRSTKCACCSY